MSRHDEGSGDEYAVGTNSLPIGNPTTTEQKLAALNAAVLRVQQLREELRADYEAMRALFGRQRTVKPKVEKPAKRGRKVAKDAAADASV